MKDCVFCEIVAGKADAMILGETRDTLTIIPLGPVVLGHVLVIPREHVRTAASDPEVTARVMTDAARWARERGPFNLITSAGREATQSIDHLHVHYIPRSAGDGMMLPWGDNTKHVV